MIVEWDVFISHASEDKEAVVRPLARIIEKEGFKVWLDEQQLLLGDSLLQRIQEGIRKSKFGVVVLSHAYFSQNKKWTKQELTTLWSLEGNSKRILPVLHGLRDTDLAEYWPMLLDRVYVSTIEGTEAVARKILDSLRGTSCHNDAAQVKFQEGKFYFHALRYEEALAAFDAALALEHDYWQATIYKGMLLKRLNRLQEALAVLNDLLTRFPGCEEAWFNRACYKCLLKFSPEGVLADLKEAMSLYPPNIDYAQHDDDLDQLKHHIVEAVRQWYPELTPQ